MVSEWQWSEDVKRYRDPATGRFLSASKTVGLRDDFLERRRSATDDLATNLASGDLSVQRWERDMRTVVKQTFGVQYAFGRGGTNAMTADDWRAAGVLVTEQNGYLRGFAEDVAAGMLSPEQIAARSALYLGSSVRAYEQGRAAAFGGLVLPAHPGDGSSECKASDRCSWSIVETESEYRCTWKRSAQESCVTCVRRASEWSPLVIARAGGRGLRVVA